MKVSRKSQYALSALLLLAGIYGEKEVGAGEIAKSRQVPRRFLEVILNELKKGGFVSSTRGCTGGYKLQREPGAIRVGDVLRFIEGSFQPVNCLSESECDDAYRAFVKLWSRAQKASENIFDSATLADLLRYSEEDAPE